jgi:hypothetical protein
MKDVWTQAAEGGDDQVKRELLAEAGRIKLFIELASKGKIKFSFEPRDEEEQEDSLLEQLSSLLYGLDGNYPFPYWVKGWYQKAKAWKAAGHVDPELGKL